MQAEEARGILSSLQGDDEPVLLPASVLPELAVGDMAEGVSFQVGSTKDGSVYLTWDGSFYRDNDAIVGEADYLWTRKYWYSPIGLEQYLDLIRRAVETRHRTRGDVELIDYDDDGAFISFHFRILTNEKNLARAYDAVRNIASELEEAAEQTADEIGQRIAQIAARLSGWGSETLDDLADRVGSAASTDAKGRTLEELCSRLFESVPGFTITGRVRTETEEIDISVLNDSPEARFRRERAIILAECKNWTSKCGKNEFVVFQQKMANRSQRCSLGFLISWNGFAETVTKEMLRGSREELLIVPMTGEHIRSAVREGNFLDVLVQCWDRAVNT